MNTGIAVKYSVIPAQAGTHGHAFQVLFSGEMGPRLRGDDTSGLVILVRLAYI